MDRLPDGLALFGDCVKQDGALIRVTVPVPNAMFRSIDAFLMLVPGGPMEPLEPLTKEGGRPLGGSSSRLRRWAQRGLL